MAGMKMANWDWLWPRLIEALCAVISMYFFFMILDRLLSVTFGFNFQPYGPQVPIGFPIWGHIVD
ncbi:MAG: hypothetical protein QW358_04735, partial [Candidatus Hadarchaeum sp.]